MNVRSDRTDVNAVVIVEGVSDQIGIEALAERRGLDLAAAGIQVVRLGGAHRIGNLPRATAHGRIGCGSGSL
jgi:hypothetical protein